MTLTNMQVGALIGLSEASVSRLRAGLRNPTWATMRRVAEALTWPVPDQAAYRENGSWAEEFERRLGEHAEQAAP